MKFKAIVSVSCLCLCLGLSACSVETPFGKLAVTDSGNIKYVDNDGKKTVIKLGNAKEYVDDLLSNVSVPGGNNDELKKFVYEKLDAVGIDLSTLSSVDTESIKKAEKAIEKALEEKGIDPDKFNINIEEFLTSIAEENDGKSKDKKKEASEK